MNIFWGIRLSFFFFFNDTATTEIYTLSLHDALPICSAARAASKGSPNRINSAARMYPMRAGSEEVVPNSGVRPRLIKGIWNFALWPAYTKSQCVSMVRSEEHTSELQSHLNLVCRLLL